MDLELVNFDPPSEVRTFEKGKFEVYKVGPTTLGRATYEPGWRWSEHVGMATGETSCQVEHVGLVLQGQAVAKMDAGTRSRDARRRFLLCPAGTRQLGGRRGAVRLAPHPRQRGLRSVLALCSSHPAAKPAAFHKESA